MRVYFVPDRPSRRRDEPTAAISRPEDILRMIRTMQQPRGSGIVVQPSVTATVASVMRPQPGSGPKMFYDTMAAGTIGNKWHEQYLTSQISLKAPGNASGGGDFMLEVLQTRVQHQWPTLSARYFTIESLGTIGGMEKYFKWGYELGKLVWPSETALNPGLKPPFEILWDQYWQSGDNIGPRLMICNHPVVTTNGPECGWGMRALVNLSENGGTAWSAVKDTWETYRLLIETDPEPAYPEVPFVLTLFKKVGEVYVPSSDVVSLPMPSGGLSGFYDPDPGYDWTYEELKSYYVDRWILLFGLANAEAVASVDGALADDPSLTSSIRNVGVYKVV